MSKPPYPSQKRVRTWEGGFVRLSRDGREVFVIERGINGRAWKVTLDAQTHRQALAELALFERDPEGYRTRAQQRRERAAASAPGLRLDAAALAAFDADAKARVDAGELSPGYVRHTLQPYLRAWADALGGRELRTVTLAELRVTLAGWESARHKRVVALKAFTAWARSAGRLDQKDDPSLWLEVPKVTPRPVADRAFTAEQVATFYAALRDYTYAPGYGDDAPPEAPRLRVDLQPIRDVFLLRALCGMHGTEIERLARGEGRIRVLEGEGEIAAVLEFKHKNGGAHAVSIGCQALAAAQRLQAAGRAPDRVATSRAVARVIAARPELDGFSFERLRHTFVTLSANGGRLVTARAGGVSLDAISQVTGHSIRTARRHYLGVHIPPMVVVPLVLVNADDEIHSPPLLVS
ncbi:hypothetical protein [Myxococcus sp. Y35]|uniref:hypothetical protein n=1 Tax=Pseudomyxococcus flavus TaxID=3115648 RepID=UPI003CFADD53